MASCPQRQPFDLAAYRTFLGKIGYLVQERDDFTVDTENVDDEIARIAATGFASRNTSTASARFVS
jgi:hypothetical protein